MQILRILIVEDYEPFRRFVSLSLRHRADFQIIGEASDGLEAIQKAEELQPDLILLDLGLPTMDGIVVAKRARKVAPQAKLLFVSQESSSDVIRETFRLGAQGYVHKSRAQRDLLPAIEAVARGRQFVSSGLEFGGLTDAEARDCHKILLYSDEVALLEGLTRFIAAALAAGNAAMVLVSGLHRDRLLRRLRTEGVDIDAATRRGTYITWEADEMPDPIRFVEVVERLRQTAAEAGKKHPRVSICGDCAARLYAQGKADEAIRLEHMSNVLVKSHDVDILCAYPLPKVEEFDQALNRLHSEHAAVYAG
jgi:DNA-binding NarL/FixJ family response regulator